MRLIDQIRQQKNEARKIPDRGVEVGILNLLIGEVETVEKRTGKEFTDAQVIDAVKKLIKSNEETLKLGQRQNITLVAQNIVLKALLPAQLAEEDIRQIISENDLHGIQAVMKFFNENYSGQFDKGLTSQIAKSL